MFFLPIHVRRIFWTYVQLPVMTGSTSCFLRTLKLVTSTCFPSNPSTLNSMKIFSTSGYGFRSLLVCRKHYENVTSTLFLNKTSTLNTMKIFSASGYDVNMSDNIQYNKRCVTTTVSKIKLMSDMISIDSTITNDASGISWS